MAYEVIQSIGNRYIMASTVDENGVHTPKIEAEVTIPPISIDTVAISNFPAVQEVCGTVVANVSFPPSQTVDGSVSISNLPAVQEVCGTVNANVSFPATQEISGSVSISNLPAVQEISGSISISNQTAYTAAAPMPVVSPIIKSYYELTRANTTSAYIANDVIGTDSTSTMPFTGIGSIQGGGFIINNVEFMVAVSAVAAGMDSFKLHLYDADPTAIADNAAFNIPSGDRAKYLGYIIIPNPVDYGETIYSCVEQVNKTFKLANGSTTIYGMLSPQAGYTPTASAVYKITINGMQV